MRQLRDMGALPIEAPASADSAQQEQPKTQWDGAHTRNRAERRKAMREYMPRADRVQVFGTPTPTRARR